MLGYNRTITCTSINILLNIGPEVLGEKKEVKKATFLTLLMMIVVQMLCCAVQVLNSGVTLELLLHPCWRAEDVPGEDCDQSSLFSCPSGSPLSSLAVLYHMKGLLPYLVIGAL